jgi:hypothetical protein
MSKTETLQFEIHGDFITNYARNIWIENRLADAVKFLIDSLPGLTEIQAIEICSGYKKLTGKNNNVNLVTDDTKKHKNVNLSFISAMERVQKLIPVKDDDIYIDEEVVEIKKIIKSDPECNSLNAWISPDGLFYPCNRCEHSYVALEVTGEDESVIEKKGWIKIVDSPIQPIIAYDYYKLTDAQKNTIWAWCLRHDRKYPKFLIGAKDDVYR